MCCLSGLAAPNPSARLFVFNSNLALFPVCRQQQCGSPSPLPLGRGHATYALLADLPIRPWRRTALRQSHSCTPCSFTVDLEKVSSRLLGRILRLHPDMSWGMHNHHVTGAELCRCFADNNQGGGASTANNSELHQCCFPGALVRMLSGAAVFPEFWA